MMRTVRGGSSGNARMVKAVLFDLDETLFDRIASLKAFVAHQFASNFGQFASVEALVERFNALDDRNNVHKTQVYSQIFKEMGRAEPDVWRTSFQDYEMNFWRFAKAFSGMTEVLSELRRDGTLLGIVTNGETHIQQRSILALGLDRLVDVVLISEAENCRKPDRTIFLRAAEQLNVAPQDCAFVGDTPQTDMLGARNTEMRTIWFPNGMEWPRGYDWHPDAEISQLQELPALVTAPSVITRTADLGA